MASLNQRNGVLGRKLAAHLLRRTTLGVSKSEIDLFATKTADAAVDDLLQIPAPPPPPVDPKTGFPWVTTGPGSGSSSDYFLFRYVTCWWAHEAFSTTTLAQNLVFFLHQNFCCNDGIPSSFLFHQLSLFRQYAKGSYKELAKKMCMDNGMLLFLDGGLSSNVNPNENFAREFLELFTIGKGPLIGLGNYTTYTEADIKEAARLFTGLKYDFSMSNIDTSTGIPKGNINTWQHDNTSKTFTAAFANTTIQGRSTITDIPDEISDFVDMVFAKSATATNICRKLYRFFVHKNITTEIETDVIGPMATSLMNNNYELEFPIKLLLKSQHFFDEDDLNSSDEFIGGLIKNPLELYIGTLKYFDVQLPDPAVDLHDFYHEFYLEDLFRYLCLEAGFEPFNPPNVAGYTAYYQEPGYDDLWINSSTLSFRFLFGEMLLTGSRILAGGNLDVQLDPLVFVTNTSIIPDYQGLDALGNTGPHAGARIADHLVQSILENVFPDVIDTNRFNYFLDVAFLGNLSISDWLLEWDTYVINGNSTVVKARLDSLIKAIIQSPEYQCK